jgi:hypothetical protein
VPGGTTCILAEKVLITLKKYQYFPRWSCQILDWLAKGVAVYQLAADQSIGQNIKVRMMPSLRLKGLAPQGLSGLYLYL